MKTVLIILASFLFSSLASADLGGLAAINCKYKSGTKTKKPVVTLSTVYSGDNYNPKITLSVAYNEDGQKFFENAIVTNAYYTENYEGYIVEAVTTSLKTIVISIYVETGDASMTVDDVFQDHMNNLKCTYNTAG